MTREVSRLTAAGAQLGESPVWDEASQGLYWVDIERGDIHYWNAQRDRCRTWTLPQQIGCVALRRDAPGLIAGLESSIALISLESLAPEQIAHPESGVSGNRYNDGKCDRAGRFWVGTCDRAFQRATGWLYRIEASGHAERTAGPFICMNGPAFSRNGATLYCVDTFARTVFALPVDAAGDVGSTRPLVHFSDPSWGYPDGLTCDQEDCLWIAHWGGGRVSRFSPRGELLQSIRLPASQVTSCTLGGPQWKTLFITLAALGLSAAEATRSDAGALFAVEVDVPGLAAERFAG